MKPHAGHPRVHPIKGLWTGLATCGNRSDVMRARALLLTQALCDVCAISETDVRALAAKLSPVPRIVTLGGTTLDGVYADIQAVAQVMDASDEAEELLAGLRDRVKHVHEILKNNRDRLTQPAQGDWVSPQHDNLRGPQNYQ